MTQTPRHVIHRGSDGSPCFVSDEDYLVYLDCLKEAAERHGAKLHAYALMPGEVQLLASLDSETSLAQWLRFISERYVEYVDYTRDRNGDFWAEPQVTAVEGGKDVLDRYLAIECAPVRSGLAAGPADYRWSSHCRHACGAEDAIVQEHPSYLALGATQLARQLAYHELLRQLSAEREPAATGRATDRYPLQDAIWHEDGIRRSVRGLRWQAMNARSRGAARPRTPQDTALARSGYASDIPEARARAVRRLASKYRI
jgi:putative transposase